MHVAIGRPEARSGAVELVEAPVPQPGPRQVRIAVAATAVNCVDVAVSNAHWSDSGAPPTPPRPAAGVAAGGERGRVVLVP